MTAPGSTLVLATASEQATVVLVAVLETAVLEVPAWHADCTGCPGWRCQAHDDAEIALRCAQQHATRKHTPTGAIQ